LSNDKNKKRLTDGGESAVVRKKSSEASASTSQRRKKENVEAVPESSRFVHQFIPYILIVAAIFLTACYLLSGVDGAMGVLGRLLRNLLCGLFGWPAFLIPVVLVNLAIFWRKYVDMHMVNWKLILSGVTLVLVAALVHVCTIPAINETTYTWGKWGASLFGTGEAISNWSYGLDLIGGGFIGGFIGGFLRCIIGFVGSMIILISTIAVCVMFLLSVTPRYVWTVAKYKIMLWRENRAAALAEQEAQRAEMEKEEQEARIKSAKRRESASRPDPEDEEFDFEAEQIKGSVQKEEYKAPPAAKREKSEPLPFEDIVVAPAKNEDESATVTAQPVRTAQSAKSIEDTYSMLDDIFGESGADAAPAESEPIPLAPPASAPASAPAPAPAPTPAPAQEEKEAGLEITLTRITDAEGAVDAVAPDEIDPSAVRKQRSEQLAAYIYPPVELLHEIENPSNEDVATELRTNAQKLMKKLDSFNVKINKIEYSRGPTITRYELYPESGTRVRSIANLSDDIALELATTVRIEAPIPNKSAVGVEVPNKCRATVFIRELIESEKFRNMPSKLSACLGKDVGGNMIFFDIAKMPHLLIAGTTGAGKSVCMNCVILSLLFKARPDEVQFLMIDPKKIEMGMYNRLPHLKVPVVTDMKKAAGTLNAAVNEMEHRYELLEEVGVRDLDSYNRVMSADDPDFVKIPKLVIFIDELADLMMTAHNEVESSIIRLAQKARAAGIHLIIGTQRPSVDVITGLIKANVPSRISFAVASQTDSRVIMDMGGAEKLIGKGDMLYAPIGSTKPVRVQGAFVADDEVEAVTEFIKNNSCRVEYDSEFMSEIERETERLAASDKKGGADLDSGEIAMQEADPLFTQALRIAVENGTVATSFLQRKLSIGFGRAGKIIDRMEALGFVSAANGTKPRNVLLTKQQLMEMEMAKDPRVMGNFN
jgi:S-DNA-T family DNA segregation ATPase FtsK/SpoIIIE